MADFKVKISFKEVDTDNLLYTSLLVKRMLIGDVNSNKKIQIDDVTLI